MFEAAELGREVGKQEYRKEVELLRPELLRVQNELRVDPAFSVVVVISGVDVSGKIVR